MTPEPPCPVNVALALAEMARLRPHSLAILCPEGRGPMGQVRYTTLTFAELASLTDTVAHGLDRIGVRRGTRTVLMVPPGLEFFVLTFALFKVGAVPVLIDPGMGVRRLGRCLAEARPEAFVGVSKAHAARVVLGWCRESVRVLVTVGPRWFWGGHRFRDLADGPIDKPYPLPPTTVDDLAAVLFTSGSTGPAKGVRYTHGMFATQVDRIREVFGIQPGEVDLCTFPLFALFAPALGMTAIVPEMDATRPANVDPWKIIGPVRKFGVTNLFGSPALLRRVATVAEQAPQAMPTLRRVISAGAPVGAEVLERFGKLLAPDVPIHTPYGATEAMPVCVIDSREILSETRHRTTEGAGTCVGRPIPGAEVAVVRIEDGPLLTWSDDLCVPPGQVGEIVVRGPMVSQAYDHRPEADALAKIRGPDGQVTHRMGDLGWIDDHGRLWFQGRKAHRVRTAAGDLFTIACEAVFNAHPDVARTALVGVGPPGQQEPVLCVELKAPVSKRQNVIAEELYSLGAARSHTARIRTVLFHPAFPVDIRHNAKIFREKLAVWAAQQLRRPGAGVWPPARGAGERP